MRSYIAQYRYPLLLIVLFAVQFFFISPRGEFALNDDWVAAEMIKHWVETGELRMNPFTGPTLHFMLLYGALIVKFFGFSFTVLRLSTLLFMLGTILVTYHFLKRVTNREGLSFFGALLIWLNPIAYNLSFTFMTDIPALFFVMVSAYAYYRAFTERSTGWLIAGSSASVIGAYTRQTDILVLAAAGLAFLLWHRSSFRFRSIVIGFALPILCGGAVYLALGRAGLMPEGDALHVIPDIREAALNMAWWAWYSLSYLGLFFLPLAILSGTLARAQKLALGAAVAVLVIAAGVIYQTTGALFPYTKNMISVFGLSPMAGALQGNLVPIMGETTQRLLSFAGAVGAGWLIWRLASGIRLNRELRFLALCAGLLLVPILLLESFDRYLLPVAATLLPLVLYKLKDYTFTPGAKLTTMGIVVALSIFSISQTAFYLSWNETRWRLANAALAFGIRAEDIDGGYECDGWRSYWSAAASGTTKGPVGAPWWIRHLIVTNTQNYVVSASTFSGYEVVTTAEAEGLNPNRRLYLLKRQAE